MYHVLTFRNLASFIEYGHTATLNTLYFFYFFSKFSRTEFFNYAALSPFVSLQNDFYFLMLPFFIPVSFAFDLQGVLT
jgi:hypothetical protein